jgi:hypothetical protein
MINYGYFRHRFDAHLDPKLSKFVDDIGVVGYAFYYTLIEIYGSHYSKKEANNVVQITVREIANTWRKRVDSVDLVMTKLQLSGLLVYTKTDSTYSVDIPNFLKYYGSYKKKEARTPSNKRKEKEIKEKESKINTSAKSEPSTSDVREAYKKSYYLRYEIYPVWSVKENSLAKKLIASIGLDEAKQLAEFYPNYRDRFHEQKKHPFALLVSQVDQVRVASNGKVALPDYGNPYTKKLKELERLEKLNEVKNV